jgi:hypothetical protein
MMMTVVKLRDDAPELVPHVSADVVFFCHELRRGDELHRTRRDGQLRRFRVDKFIQNVKRSKRMAEHNKRVHPKDTIVLKEVGIRRAQPYEVNALYIELSTRWGLVRDE